MLRNISAGPTKQRKKKATKKESEHKLSSHGVGKLVLLVFVCFALLIIGWFAKCWPKMLRSIWEFVRNLSTKANAEIKEKENIPPPPRLEMWGKLRKQPKLQPEMLLLVFSWEWATCHS